MNSHDMETCPVVEELLQWLMDYGQLEVSIGGREEPQICMQSEEKKVPLTPKALVICFTRKGTDSTPIYPRTAPKPTPFAYQSNKAVPWKYNPPASSERVATEVDSLSAKPGMGLGKDCLGNADVVDIKGNPYKYGSGYEPGMMGRRNVPSRFRADRVWPGRISQCFTSAGMVFEEEVAAIEEEFPQDPPSFVQPCHPDSQVGNWRVISQYEGRFFEDPNNEGRQKRGFYSYVPSFGGEIRPTKIGEKLAAQITQASKVASSRSNSLMEEGSRRPKTPSTLKRLTKGCMSSSNNPRTKLGRFLQKAVAFGGSNPARLGELGGKLLPQFSINRGRSEVSDLLDYSEPSSRVFLFVNILLLVVPTAAVCSSKGIIPLEIIKRDMTTLGVSMGTNQTGERFYQVKVKGLDTTSIKELGRLMEPLQMQAFRKTYGKILELTIAEVSIEAIASLTQYYDQPLRCFTFGDFQLVPTIEEFEEILGCPLGGRKPYLSSGCLPSLSRIATVVKDSARGLDRIKQTRNGIAGLPRKYLEDKVRGMANQGDWVPFMDVLALLIFGVVLFPNVDGLVDLAAIDTFLAYHHSKESPVVVVLADLFDTFDRRCEKSSARIICCLPALCVWLISHLFQQDTRHPCSLQCHRSCTEKRRIDWDQLLAGIGGRTINWFPRWKEGKEGVLFSCGGYPNIPLIGTRGCINYNPALAIRQLGYPMRGAPMEESVSPFLVRDFGAQNFKAIQRIHKAWETPLRKDQELRGIRNGIIGGYHEWLKVHIRGLDWLAKLKVVSEESFEAPEEDEEVQALKSELGKAKLAKEKFKLAATHIRKECAGLREENATIARALEQEAKRACKEEYGRLATAHEHRVADEYAQVYAEKEARGRVIDSLHQEATMWMDRFALTLNGSQELPRLLAKAKAMADTYPAPEEIHGLLGYYIGTDESRHVGSERTDGFHDGGHFDYVSSTSANAKRIGATGAKRKEGDAHAVSSTPAWVKPPQTPHGTHQYVQHHLSFSAHTGNASSSAPVQPKAPTQREAPQVPAPNTTRPAGNSNATRNFPPRPFQEFTPLPMTYEDLLPSLIANHLAVVTPEKVLQPPFPKWYDPNATCKYHGGVPGHSIEKCLALKYKVQHLIDVGWLTFQEDRPNVRTNPLANHGGGAINAVESDRPRRSKPVKDVATPRRFIFEALQKGGVIPHSGRKEDSCLLHSGELHDMETCLGVEELLQRMIDQVGSEGREEQHICMQSTDGSSVAKPKPLVIYFTKGTASQKPGHPLAAKPVPFPYQNSHTVPWRYTPPRGKEEEATDVSSLSAKVTNITGLNGVTRGLMMARVMLGNCYEPGMGLGKDNGGITSLINAKGNRGKYGLGYKPTQADIKRSIAGRKSGGQSSRLRQESEGSPPCHISRSFISAGLGDEGQVVAIYEDDVPSTLDLVRPCPPDFQLGNWRSPEGTNTWDPSINFEQEMNQTEDEGNEDVGLPPELERMVAQPGPLGPSRRFLQKAVASGGSNPARLGELGGKHLPYFAITRGGSEKEKEFRKGFDRSLTFFIRSSSFFDLQRASRESRVALPPKGMAPTRHPLDPDKSNRVLGFPALITRLCQSFGVPVAPTKVIRPPITRAFIENEPSFRVFLFDNILLLVVPTAAICLSKGMIPLETVKRDVTTLGIITKKPFSSSRLGVASLKELGQLMGQLQRQAFCKAYGKIWDLTMVEVSTEAIASLAQYYDQSLRCFTFGDFQLTPTMEEFEEILGCPLGGRKPYLFLGFYPSLARISKLVRISTQELDHGKQVENGVVGVPRKCLEAKVRTLASQDEWAPFMDVLTLLIFRVVLFPNVDGLVDRAAIDAFLAFYNRKESPVVAILANLYDTFDRRCEKNNARIICCTPALYVWLVSHLFRQEAMACSPLKSRMCCPLKARACSPRKASTYSPLKARMCSPLKERACSPLKPSESESVQPSQGEVRTCSPLKVRACDPLKATTCSPLKARTCSPLKARTCCLLKVRTCTPLKVKACSPLKARACSPLKVRTCCPLKARTCSPLKARVCNPLMAKACSPLKVKTCSPLKARACRPLKARTCSPLKVTTCSALKVRACGPLKARTCSPLKAWTCSPLKARTCSPLKVRACSPLKARACSLLKVKTCCPLMVRMCSPLKARMCSPHMERACSPLKARTCSPLKVRACSPLKARTCSPLKAKTCSPLKVTTCSPLKVRACGPLKARTCSPLKVRTCSSLKARTRSPLKSSESEGVQPSQGEVRTCNPLKVRACSPLKEKACSPLKSRTCCPLKARACSPLKARTYSPLKARTCSPLKASACSPLKLSESESVQPSQGEVRTCSPLKAKECDPLKARTCSPLKARTCCPLKVRTCSPLKVRACSPLKARTCCPLKARTCSPLKARVCNPLMARACSPLKVRTCSPLKVMACSPLKARVCRPLKARTCSPLKVTTCSALKVRACGPLKARTCSPLQARTCSPLKARTCSPLKLRVCSPLKARACSLLKVKTCFPLKVRTCSPLRARMCSPLKARMCSPLMARACSPLKARTCSPLKVRACSPLKVRMCSPLKAKTCSPLKVTTCSPLKVRACGPLKARTCSPLKVRTCSSLKARTRSPLKVRVRNLLKARTCCPLKTRACSPLKASCLKVRACSPLKAKACSPLKSSESEGVQPSQGEVKTCSPLKARACGPLKVRTCSPLKTRTCSPLLARTCSPLKVRVRNPLKARTCSPLKVSTCSPLKVRACSPLKARACNPLKVRTCSPLKARACSPLKARACSPLKERTWSPLKARTCSPLKVKACNPLKAIAFKIAPCVVSLVNVRIHKQFSSNFSQPASIRLCTLRFKVIQCSMECPGTPP
ncbi:Neurofilament heavy polypeptide [Glycine soja]